MAINKNASKILKSCVLQVTFVSGKFFQIVFISSSYDSVTSSHVITKTSIILAKYFLFSQLHVAEFQT